MTFEQKINEDLKESMKSGDKLRLETLRSLRASIIEFSKSGTGKDMSEVLDSLKSIIQQAGAEGPKDMGKVMGLAMKELRGKADGTLVQQCLKQLLQP